MPEPIYLKIEKPFAVPLVKLWETVALGFGNVADYNPELKSSQFDSEKKSGVGAKRHCNFPKKGYIKEEIIAWNDQESFELTFTESSVPLGSYEVSIHLDRKATEPI